MSLFMYEAIREAGTVERGEVAADNSKAAASVLLAKGYHILSLEDSETAGGSARALRLGTWTGLSRRELTQVTRDVASLLRAGLTLSAALDVLRARLEKPGWRRITAGIRSGLEEGQTFAEALGRYPLVFDAMYISLVRAGEESGKLVEVLTRLADVGEQRDELVARLKMAMLYPSVMAALGGITIAILLTFVVPMFTGVFQDTGQALPWPTQALVSLSHYLKAWWPLLFPSAVLSIFLAIRFQRSPKGQQATGRLLLRMPVLHRLVRKAEVAAFARTLSTLLESGVTIVRALAITSTTLRNQRYQEAVTVMAAAVREGESLSRTLDNHPLFPKTFPGIIAVGEESGTLSDALQHVADEHEKEMDREVKAAMSLLEPAMIVLMGGVVGFIVMAMLLPIFALGDAVAV